MSSHGGGEGQPAQGNGVKISQNEVTARAKCGNHHVKIDTFTGSFQLFEELCLETPGLDT